MDETKSKREFIFTVTKAAPLPLIPFNEFKIDVCFGIT